MITLAERIQDALMMVDDEMQQKIFDKNYYKWLEDRLLDNNKIYVATGRFFIWEEDANANIFLGGFIEKCDRYYCAYLLIAFDQHGL